MMEDEAAARGPRLTWMVAVADMAYPGRVTARAQVADHQGGTCRPGTLVADTLDALRVMVPAELTRRD